MWMVDFDDIETILFVSRPFLPARGASSKTGN